MSTEFKDRWSSNCSSVSLQAANHTTSTVPTTANYVLLEERVEEYIKCLSDLGIKWTSWRRLHVPAHSDDIVDLEGPKVLFKRLHAVSVELNLTRTIMSFADELGMHSKQTLNLIEDLCTQVGYSTLKPGERAAAEGHITCN